MEQLSPVQRDEELVPLILKDKGLFGVLIERYEAKLKRYITRLGVRNPDDQLDVMQEIFLKVYKNLNGFDTKLSFSSWIYRIAHNEAISWYRKLKVRPEGHLVADSDEVLSFVAHKDMQADVAFDSKLDAKALNAALSEIEPKYREVIVLRYFEHKEYEDIADILKMPVGSVGTLLHRGKKQLQNVLKKQKLRI